MERLASRDLENLRVFLQETSSPCDLSTFASRVMPALGLLIPGDLVCYAQIDPVQEKVVTQVIRAPNAEVPVDSETFERHMMSHPVFVHWAMSGDDSPVRTSDFVTRQEWHQNDLYQNFYKGLSCEDSLPVGLPAPAGLVSCFCIERAKNFTDREVQLMNVIKPHLANAYRNAEAFTLLGMATEAGGPHSLVLDKDNLPIFVAPATRALIASYFPQRSAETFSWPASLTSWIAVQLRRFASAIEVPFAAEPLIVRGADGATLTIRLMVGHLTGDQALLVLQEHRAPSVLSEVPADLGLTSREAEVLVAAARGLSSAEIADALYLSRRTVEKHLENIYSKLGVESRAAAVAMAFLSLD